MLRHRQRMREGGTLPSPPSRPTVSVVTPAADNGLLRNARLRSASGERRSVPRVSQRHPHAICPRHAPTVRPYPQSTISQCALRCNQRVQQRARFLLRPKRRPAHLARSAGRNNNNIQWIRTPRPEIRQLRTAPRLGTMNRYNTHIFKMFKTNNTEWMNRYNALKHFAIALQKFCTRVAVSLQKPCSKTAELLQKHCSMLAVILQRLCSSTARRMQ